MSELDIGPCETTIWPEREKGGQHVGAGPQGVRVRHIETGIIVCCDTQRSQHRNLQIAKHMIAAAITHPSFQGGRW